jgi:hypothetical protein
MKPMTGAEPGERRDERTGAAGRQLERPPSDRYARDERSAIDGPGTAGTGRLAPVAKAAFAAVVGTALLFAVGALFASTAGLLFVAALTGAAVGLLLARAAVPGAGDAPVLSRRQVSRLAIALTITSIAAGAVATWLYARGEGGTLDVVDYLLTTFGPFVPGEVVIGTIAAAWGVSAGPVEG